MNLFPRLVLTAMLSYSTHCTATTWDDIETADPIDSTSKCIVHAPMSFGGYIYNWPEKYDQVFWPLTDEKGIWFCEKTGFTAFLDDFEDITSSEKERIREYLQDNYKGERTIEVKLKLLEDIYALRNTDGEFDNMLLRVLARWHQNLDRTDTANAYRLRALQHIQSSLQGELPEKQKLEYLYLAANYSRLFGDIDTSDDYITELQQSIVNIKDKEFSEFVEYLSELAKEIPRIEPGGKLDPEQADDT